jgi:nucleolar protein 58
MARMVATKAALSIRVDALTDADGKSESTAPSIGLENRSKLESRLRALEHQNGMSEVRRYADGGKQQQRFQMTGETKTYNTAADAVDLVSTQREPADVAMQAVLDVKEERRKAKEEKKAKRRAEKEKAKESDAPSEDEDGMDVDEDEAVKKDKKDKKRKRRESEKMDVVQDDEPVSIHFNDSLSETDAH